MHFVDAEGGEILAIKYLTMTGRPDPDEDPAESGVVDDLQDLVGSVRDHRGNEDEDRELDFSCGGKLPPDHPDADVFDDLDL